MSRPNISSQVPGDFNDAKVMQDFNNRRKFSKGYAFNIAGGGLQTFDTIQFPGTARMLLGITAIDTSGDPRNRLTFELNNEKMINGVSWADLTKTNLLRTVAGQVTGSSYNEEFYKYIRGLTGSDSISLAYESFSSGVLLLTFHFKTLMTATEI